MESIIAYENLRIRSFKRIGRKRLVDMVEVRVNDKYRKVLNDIRPQQVLRLENKIEEIIKLNTFSDDKCFLISECIQLDEEIFEEILENYIKNRIPSKTKHSLYRLDVDIILSTKERRLIVDRLKSWECHGNGYKSNDIYIYHVPSHVLYNKETKIPADGYLKELMKIK